MIGAALVAGVIALAPGTTQSFESMTKVPADWQTIQYNAGVSTISIKSGDAADGSKFVRLSAPKENHTRLFVPLKVEANSSYKVSAQVRVTGSKGQDSPAVLALDGNSGVTTPGIPDDGTWRERDLYIRTGASDKVKLVLSLGWFGNVTTGVADFDDLKVEKIDAVPDGATAVAEAADLNAAEAPPQSAPAGVVEQPKDDNPPGGTIGLIVVLAVLAGIAIKLLMHDGGAKDESDEPTADATPEPDADEAPEAETADTPAESDADEAPEPDADSKPDDADGREA